VHPPRACLRAARLTGRGLAFAAAAKTALLAIEDELTTILGERRMTRLKADLTAIPAGLEGIPQHGASAR
jgi:hypothetical protein